MRPRATCKQSINAARGQLPANLPSNPTYRKINPADSPVLILGLTSDTMEISRMYDAADSILAQRLSQVPGIGQAQVGGGAKPAVRILLNPTELNKYGIGSDTIRNAMSAANANNPVGQLSSNQLRWELHTTDQLFKAKEYRPLIVAYRNGAPIRLSDVADVQDSVENRRNVGFANGKPAVLIILFKQPAANMIETVDRVYDLLPRLQASIPPAIKLTVMMDRTTTIRASIHDVERTLLLSIGLVIMVVFVFLRNVRATLIPSVAVPLSLIGTCGVMYLLGYSLDNLSLMALTVSTGFVVDDAIVVIENISRYREAGMPAIAAALRGAREIGFTVVSMSISLVAVFIPILLMGGIMGRLFREFAVTLAVAVTISMVVSLTTTPMMCAVLLQSQKDRKHNWAYRTSERGFNRLLKIYEGSLAWVLRHPPTTLAVLFLTIGCNIYLYVIVPKGFFPQQDTGRLMGMVQASQDISFPAMRTKVLQFVNIVKADPAVASVAGFIGGGNTNTAMSFISLKPLDQRGMSGDQVIERMRPKLSVVPGATQFMQVAQEVRVGGRMSNTQYPIHFVRRHLERAKRVGAEIAGHHAGTSATARYQFRPANQRARIHAGFRSGYGGAVRHFTANDRQRALRFFWTAASIHHVHAHESVPRGDGGGTAIPAKSRGTEEYLRSLVEGSARSPERVYQLQAFHHRACRKPSGTVPVHNAFPSIWRLGLRWAMPWMRFNRPSCK